MIYFNFCVKVSLVAEERDRNINRVQELEASIVELKNAAGEICFLSFIGKKQLHTTVKWNQTITLACLLSVILSFTALLSVEKEAQENAEPQPSGPSEAEVALQEALSSLQQEKDAITAQYQAQVCIQLFYLYMWMDK